MVVLNKIYTRSGDDGHTALGDGVRVAKYDLRVSCFGLVDTVNASVGLARIHTGVESRLADLDAILGRIQNDLFDVGADLCVPEHPSSQLEDKSEEKKKRSPLRIISDQVVRLEGEIDILNADLPALKSFILPGGSAVSASLHMCRVSCRTAERHIVELNGCEGTHIGAPLLHYMNRLSDFFFVAARYSNTVLDCADILWVPGAHR